MINRKKSLLFKWLVGSVEKGELPLQAAIRECHEELGDKAIFNSNNLEFIMDFIETSTNNPNLKIHMYIFKYNGILEGKLTTSGEIESFMWFGVDDDTSILSNTLKNEIIPYALEKGLIYKNKTL